MDKILKQWLYIFGLVVFVVLLSGRFIGKKEDAIVLPAKLASVKCLPAPDNDKHAQTNRALLEYDHYAIYNLCIPSYMMASKDELKCGYNEEENPDLLLCDDSAVLKQNYVHAGISDIYATDSPNTRTPNAKSKVTISLSQQSLPLSKPSFKYYTKETYIRKGIVTPSKFRLRNEPVCQSPIGVNSQGNNSVERDTSSCFVDVSFNALNIKLEIEGLANDYGNLSRNDQIKEINFWLAFVNELVIAQP